MQLPYARVTVSKFRCCRQSYMDTLPLPKKQYGT